MQTFFTLVSNYWQKKYIEIYNGICYSSLYLWNLNSDPFMIPLYIYFFSWQIIQCTSNMCQAVWGIQSLKMNKTNLHLQEVYIAVDSDGNKDKNM